MSYSPHAIEGLGFRFSDVFALLDAEKIRPLLVKQLDFPSAPGSPAIDDFDQLPNENKLVYMKYWLADKDFTFFEVLSEAEEKDLLEYSDTDTDECYLLYERQYLWNQREGEFATEAEARSYLCDFLLRFTLPKVTAEDVAPLVRFHDERAGY